MRFGVFKQNVHSWREVRFLIGGFMKAYIKGIITGVLVMVLVSCAAPNNSIAGGTAANAIAEFFLGTVRQWADRGRLGQQSLQDDDSTALDLWPTAGAKATNHSVSELTLHRTRWDEPGMERFNVSAMVHADQAAYRFGVEREAPGQFRDMIFCFEDVTPGVSNCPFKITMAGVYISDDSGQTWRKL